MNLFYKLIIIGAISFFGKNISAQINSGTVSVGSGTNQIDMTITVNSNNSTVSFSLTGPSSRWFGFGFATSSMSGGAYTILGNVNSGNPMEYNQVNHSNPTLQSTQNLSNITSSTIGGQKTYTFTRAMNTNDANDYTFLFTTSSINLIWAYGNSTTLAQHAGKGTATINLTSACNIPVTNLPAISICSGDSTMIFGNYQSQAANYYDTLLTSLGCDSIIKQELVVGQQIINQLPDTTLCYGDSIIMFGNYIKQSGLYIDTLQINSGCDSIVKINIYMLQIDTTVVESNNSLYASFAFADSYQWYNCQTNTAISGATGMTYTPTQNGSYKVEISAANCTEMTACHNVNWVGLEEIDANKINVFPNPISSNMFINIPDFNSNFRITILSIDGRILKEVKINSGTTTLDLSFLKSGMYIYKIESKETLVKSNRFIKK